MLRFDKAITFSPILQPNLLVNFNIKTCGSEVLQFSEFINIVSIFYNWIDLIKLLYTFLVIFFDWYKEQKNCLISLNKFSELLPAFTCARAIGNLWNICLCVNILSSEWSGFKIPAPLDFVKNILLSKFQKRQECFVYPHKNIQVL